MNGYFDALNIGNATIISKYAQLMNFNPLRAKISRLPNIRRCDHSWASWMVNTKEEDATNNHIILFIKASCFLY